MNLAISQNLHQRNRAYDPYVLLENIRSSFLAGRRLIPVSGELKLTKTQRALCEVLLLNDMDLTADVYAWIKNRSSKDFILNRYRAFDPRLERTELPDHFAARIVTGLGSISSGHNIFLFFPECLGVPGRKTEDYFGIELIDVWANIFHKVVFPCSRVMFDYTSQVYAHSTLGTNLDKTIYLASIFHEVGHQVGCLRVSPKPDPNLKISSFYLDVFGEMATDSLLVTNLPEFPEIGLFVMLQRLFWFGRRGFRENPLSAWINTDNDSWLSAFLWNRMVNYRAFHREGDRWILNHDQMMICFHEIVRDIERVGQEVLSQPTKEDQDRVALEWMKREVEWREGVGFVLPKGLQDIYRRCTHIEEIPLFHPLAETVFKGDGNAPFSDH